MVKRRKRGVGKVYIEWSPAFAYGIGLFTADGCLYNDGRHLSFTTKDLEQARTFKKCLKINVKIGRKTRGGSKEKKYFHVQFGDVKFYKFLLSIGLMPAKSKVIQSVSVPREYFFDFLRGTFDGDGCFYSYWDPRWRSSHMFYLEFVSASEEHVIWLQNEISCRLGVIGHITTSSKNSAFQLKYAKKEAMEIIKKMYYNPKVACLSRKKVKIVRALQIEKKQQKIYARVEKLVDLPS